MAEELNGRGAMELAVPFYRQTIALLLAEREQLRALAGATAPEAAALAAAGEAVMAVDGVLAAAAQVEAGVGLSLAELQRRVEALEQELCEANAAEVEAALLDLEGRWPAPQAQLLGLRAKLHLLAGDLPAARQHFEQALALDPDCLRLGMNTAAARLADGDAAAALGLLRPLRERAEALAELGVGRSFWTNLALSERAGGDAALAIDALAQLVDLDAEALNLELWLEQALAWQAEGAAAEARQLLELLRRHAVADDQRRQVLPPLAELLEQLGEYRQAALIYRELLRPSLDP